MTKIKTNILTKKTCITVHGGNTPIYLKEKEFLIKKLYVKSKGILSLQKHNHRAEHWLVTQGNAKNNS